MNNLSLTTLLVFISSICFSQTTETKYYNQRMDEVPQEKAKFATTITQENDGTITTSTKDIKKDRVIRSETFKGDEPLGVWVYQKLRGTGELNYNFQLAYSKVTCSNGNELEKISDCLQDNNAVGYKSPKLATGEQTIYEFIGRRLIYPANARRQGIQGVVNTTFTITKNGTIENITVNKGINILLDKEAVRILREVKFASPPMLNGQPRDICVKLPVSFRLG